MFNPRVAFGAPLPRNVRNDSDDVVRGTLRTTVSDVFNGRIAAAPLVAINAPVLDEGGALRYFLNLSLPVDRTREIIAAAGIAADTMIGVLDRKGIIVARTHRHEELVATPDRPDAVKRFAESRRGTWEGLTTDGVPVHISFARLETAGWTVALAVPVEVIDAALRHNLAIAIVFAAVLATLSAAMAILGGRRILAPVAALVADAGRVGRGEPVSDDPLSVKEFSAIRAALADASQRIAEAREHDGLLRRELSHRVSNPSPSWPAWCRCRRAA